MFENNFTYIFHICISKYLIIYLEIVTLNQQIQHISRFDFKIKDFELKFPIKLFYED